MNMFKPTSAQNIDEYFAALPEERKDILLFLHNFILEAAPALQPWFAYNMPGYGKAPCRNYKKEIIDWPVISLASQKNYISLYVCAIDHGKYVAELHKEQLGKVSVGKSCIRLRKLANVNLPELKKVIQHAAKTPGLGNV